MDDYSHLRLHHTDARERDLRHHAVPRESEHVRRRFTRLTRHVRWLRFAA